MRQHLRLFEMKPLIILFFLAIFLCGCSTTYSVRSSVKNNYMYEKLKGQPSRKVCGYDYFNEELRGQDATIELRDGKEVYAMGVQIANDSVSWFDASTYIKSKVSLEQLDKIIMKDHAIGAAEGLGLGLLSGAVVGTGIGLVLYSNSNSDYRALSILAGGIVGTVVGFVVGPITGVIIGHSYIYEFPMEQPSDSLRNVNSPQK
jgi:hypothetical protein